MRNFLKNLHTESLLELSLTNFSLNDDKAVENLCEVIKNQLFIQLLNL